jgi:hypothetical protein
LRIDTRTRQKLLVENARLQAEVDKLTYDVWAGAESRAKLKHKLSAARLGLTSEQREAAKELLKLAPRLLPEAASDVHGIPPDYAAKRVRELVAELPKE